MCSVIFKIDAAIDLLYARGLHDHCPIDEFAFFILAHGGVKVLKTRLPLAEDALKLGENNIQFWRFDQML